MADINHQITLGIGTPGAIQEFLTFGLQQGFTLSPAGGVALGGQAGYVKGKIFGVSGGMAFAGSGPLSQTSHAIPVSGGMVFSGSVPLIVTLVGGATVRWFKRKMGWIIGTLSPNRTNHQGRNYD